MGRVAVMLRAEASEWLQTPVRENWNMISGVFVRR